MEFGPAGFRFQREIVMRHAFGSEPTRGSAREKMGGVEREQNFGEDGFDARLSCFARDSIGDVVPARINRIAKAEQSRAALGKRPRNPFFLSLAGALENTRQIACAGGRKACDDFV
jgi:hypothetical protein